MMSYRAVWLADVLRAAGCRVVEQPNWKYLRPEYNLLALAGSPPTLQGVVCHHTASPPTSTLATNLSVVTYGNGVAPGPIAQLMLWRDGTFYVIGAGKANHAGAGGPYGGWIPDTSQQSVGNDRLLGIEAVNSGVGEPWAPQMLDAYETGVAAILRHLNLPASRAITHAEWAPTRKIDPAGPNGGRYRYTRGMTWNPDDFRAAVARRMNPPAPVPAPPDLEQEHDDMKPSVCKKDGKSACWLVVDRHTRTHIATGDQLTRCTNLYGEVIALSANQDLNAIAQIVIGSDPGDI